jgi:hypothetical protein
MVRTVRKFLLVLIAFAFLGGTMQFAWSEHDAAPTMMMTGMPCDIMMSMGDGHGKPAMPCKAMTPDCLKHMTGGVDAGLPGRFASNEMAVHLSTIDYWTLWSRLSGLTDAPEPLPPRTI